MNQSPLAERQLRAFLVQRKAARVVLAPGARTLAEGGIDSILELV